MPDPAPQGDRARELSASAPARASEPTLPELLAGAWRRSGRAGRAALVGLGLVAVAFAAWLVFGRGGDSFAYDGEEAPPFSISWSEMEQVDPQGKELLRLESDTETLTVEPLDLDASADEPLPELALDAAVAGSPEHVVLEGRTKLAVDRGPEAYQVAFAGPAGGDSVLIGKTLLVPDPDRPGQGVVIEITELTDDPRVAEKVEGAPAGFFLNWPIQLLLEDAASVRTEEGLEEPLRSFAFG
jgi:hypothetical protein